MVRDREDGDRVRTGGGLGRLEGISREGGPRWDGVAAVGLYILCLRCVCFRQRERWF